MLLFCMAGGGVKVLDIYRKFILGEPCCSKFHCSVLTVEWLIKDWNTYLKVANFKQYPSVLASMAYTEGIIDINPNPCTGGYDTDPKVFLEWLPNRWAERIMLKFCIAYGASTFGKKIWSWKFLLCALPLLYTPPFPRDLKEMIRTLCPWS